MPRNKTPKNASISNAEFSSQTHSCNLSIDLQSKYDFKYS
jgi:hypothetical protein